APVAGILHITAPEGSKVEIGSVVGHLDEKAAAAPPPDKDQREQPGKAAAAAVPPPPRRDEKSKPPPAPRPTAAPPAADLPLSPAGRRLAEEEEVDVRTITGTGRGGRVTKEDVVTYLEQRNAPPAPGPTAAPPAAPAAPSVPPAPAPAPVPAPL